MLEGCATRSISRSHYNQRYPTFEHFIGAVFAYVRLQIFLAINLQYFAPNSSLDIRRIVS